MIADLATVCNALSAVPSTPDGTASPHRHALTRQLDEGSAPVPLRARGHVTGAGVAGSPPAHRNGQAGTADVLLALLPKRYPFP